MPFDRKVRLHRATHDLPAHFDAAAGLLGLRLAVDVAADLDDAVALFNRLSPRLVATLVSDDDAEHARFYDRVDAPFVGNGFTRWVDGQYALARPELGLSNWENGRLFGRSAVLSGDSVFTVRTRLEQADPDLHR